MFSILGTPIKTPSGVFAIRKTAPVQVRLDMPPRQERELPPLGQIMKHRTPKCDPLMKTLADLKTKTQSRKAVVVDPPAGGKGAPVENPSKGKPAANDAVAALTARVNVLEAELARLYDELRSRPLIASQKAFNASMLGCQRHR